MCVGDSVVLSEWLHYLCIRSAVTHAAYRHCGCQSVRRGDGEKGKG